VHDSENLKSPTTLVQNKNAIGGYNSPNVSTSKITTAPKFTLKNNASKCLSQNENENKITNIIENLETKMKHG